MASIGAPRYSFAPGAGSAGRVEFFFTQTNAEAFHHIRVDAGQAIVVA
jgi:hypothetical protein